MNDNLIRLKRISLRFASCFITSSLVQPLSDTMLRKHAAGMKGIVCRSVVVEVVGSVAKEGFIVL